jgi:uncharacterized protein YrzB (UPF0473 family)
MSLSLSDTLNIPQKPDGLRILDQDGNEVFFWTPGIVDIQNWVLHSTLLIKNGF